MVSNMGNVLTTGGRRGSTPFSLIKQSEGSTSPYKKVCLRKSNEAKNVMVHRLVALAFVPNPENKSEINHKDGNKHNNHADNLEWVTRSENLLHAFRVLGVDRKNRRKTPRKLPPEKVLEIYNACGTGQEIAKRFEVSDTMVYKIKKGECWNDVTHHHPEDQRDRHSAEES